MLLYVIYCVNYKDTKTVTEGLKQVVFRCIRKPKHRKFLGELPNSTVAALDQQLEFQKAWPLKGSC